MNHHNTISVTKSRPSACFTLTASLRTPSAPQRPLVCVVGFLGCPPRVASSIARTYSDSLSYDSAWVVPPPSVVFSSTDAPKRAFALALADALASDDVRQGPVVLASFSNAGAYILCHLHEFLRDAETPERKALFASISAVVYDSGPCSFTSPVLGARALLAAAGSSSGPVDVLKAGWTSGLFWVSNVVRTGDATGSLFSRLQRAVFPNAGELYIFSDADVLCDAQALEEFLATRTLPAGKPLLLHRFHGSPHCDHVRAHRAVYLDKLRLLHLTAVRPRVAKL